MWGALLQVTWLILLRLSHTPYPNRSFGPGYGYTHLRQVESLHHKLAPCLWTSPAQSPYKVLQEMNKSSGLDGEQNNFQGTVCCIMYGELNWLHALR